MDLNQLRQTLAGWNVTPPDLNRASLYLAQIQATRTFLFTTLAADPVIGGPAYSRFQAALQDPELLNDFCAIIDDFLAPGVSADLQNPPIAYTTYDDYFDKNIYQANGGNYALNVQNFFARYPATQRAVQILTTNFQNNILTACQRIQRDWGDINTTFAPWNGQLVKLIQIESTGSDFHKGGQQVLILTFSLFIVITDNMGDVHPSSDTLQVVYKPSDLEVDCLLVGDSAAVNKVHNGFQQSSLFEILNTLIVAEQPNNPRLQTLPTYKILPYNWGSSLAVGGGGNLPIRTSYGYIQFLEHRHAPGRSILNYYPFGWSDFKIFPNQDAPQIARQFYQQVGELVAVASTFSIVDMHLENLIASRYQPHLIDLEICLTDIINDVEATKLFGNLGGITGLRVDKTGWVLLGGNGHKYLQRQIISKPYKQNRLWTMRPDQVVNPSAHAPANAIFDGFWDGLTVIRQGVGAVGGNVFNPWFVRLNNAVVRFLPFGTTAFKQTMNDIYGEDHAGDGNYYLTAILKMAATKYQEYLQNPTPEPDFVAVQAAYVDADYLNCDIPVFYHRIGSLDIMDSNGVTVTIPANLAIAKGNPPPPTVQVPVQGPLGRATYFARLPTLKNVRNGQVNSLAGNFDARYVALRATLLAELGLEAVPQVSQVIH